MVSLMLSVNAQVSAFAVLQSRKALPCTAGFVRTYYTLGSFDAMVTGNRMASRTVVEKAIASGKQYQEHHNMLGLVGW